MDETVRKLLDQIPQKAPRSKLEPHVELIRELRRKGQTYGKIAQFFGDHLKMKVVPSTIYAFVRVRARRRQRRPQVELPPAAAPNIRIGHIESTLSTDGEAEMRKRVEELKRRLPPEEVQKTKFECNANEPLRLQCTPEAKRER